MSASRAPRGREFVLPALRAVVLLCSRTITLDQSIYGPQAKACGSDGAI